MRFFRICFIISVVFMMSSEARPSVKINLPKPQLKQYHTLKIIQGRYSYRSFSSQKLTKNQVSDLLYAAYGPKVDGVTSVSRAAPSAGATYPLEVYLVVGKLSVEDIKEGVYLYLDTDSLLLIKDGDVRKELAQSALNQQFIHEAPISIIIAARYSRTTSRYGKRGVRYVDMEAGHSCQNIYLVVTELGLATVEVGAFSDMEVKRTLNLKNDIQPLSIMPVGYPE